MAGYNQGQGNRGNFRQPQANTSKPAAAGGASRERAPAIFSTGLFAPTKEGVKSLGNVQVKEDILLPAGSYINLYPVEKTKDSSPVYKIQVTPGKLKQS
jgi:hypothetical protein